MSKSLNKPSFFPRNQKGKFRCTFCDEKSAESYAVYLSQFTDVTMPLCKDHKQMLENMAEHQERFLLAQRIGV